MKASMKNRVELAEKIFTRPIVRTPESRSVLTEAERDDLAEIWKRGDDSDVRAPQGA